MTNFDRKTGLEILPGNFYLEILYENHNSFLAFESKSEKIM